MSLPQEPNNSFDWRPLKAMVWFVVSVLCFIFWGMVIYLLTHVA
jgi:hypothetical protein